MSKQILSEEFRRMQVLAGISPVNNSFDYFNEEVYEQALVDFLIEIYCSKNKILQENLSENILKKIKEKAKQLKLKPTETLAASGLTYIKEKLPQYYDQIINIIKSYKGDRSIQSVINYVKTEFNNLEEVNEGILEKIADPGKVLGIVMLGILGLNGLVSQNNIDISKLNLSPAPVEKTTLSGAAKNLGASDDNIDTISWFEAKVNNELNPSGDTEDPGDEIKGDTEDPGDEIKGDTEDPGDETNTPDTDIAVVSTDNGVNIQYSTGDYETLSYDIPNIAKDIGDEIEDRIPDGYVFDGESTILVQGSISNTGAQMDNPDGPQDSGLADLRLQTGLNFVDYIVKYLTTTYPDKFPDKEVLKNAFKDGGTNVNNPGDEVSPNSEEAKVNQATKFNLDNVKGKTTDTGDTDTGDTDDVPGTEPDLPNGKDVKTYLRTKKPEIDANKLTTIMLLILPNLITDQKLNDFWDVWFDWNSAKEQGLSRKEFIEKEGLPRDQPGYVNKKREYLSNSTDPKAKDALKIFDWALSFKKDPGGFAQLLKNLDSQINITYIKRISTKPGKRGEAAYQGGSQRVSTRASGETTATPVAENINNKLRENIKNIIKSILIEIKSFEELPGFDKNRAIRNLGAVVPLYIYTWDLEDEASIAYVRNVDTYKDSFKKFYSGYSEYPTLTRKVNAYGKTIFNLNEPGRNFDRTANSKRNERDVNKIIEKINKNNTLKTQLNKINNPIKLENLLVTALTYINPNVDKIKVLQQTKNNLPTDLKEEDNPTSSTETSDNRAVNQAIEADTALQNLIKEINNIEEGKQFILRCILPFVNKRINKSYIITAIDNAMKRLENKDDVSLSGDSSSSSSSGGSAGGSSATTGVRTNEHYLRMQFLAGIINESQYKK